MTIRGLVPESVSKVNIRTVFFLALLSGLCSGFYNVILQPYLVDFIDSEFIFGVIMTSANLAQILPMILVGKVSDRIGRKRVHMVGFFLYVPAMILFALAGEIQIAMPLFLVISGLMLLNIGFGVSDPALMALVAESSHEKKRSSSFSLLGLGTYASALVGPIIIRIFAGKIPLYYYFYGLIAGYSIYFLYQLLNLKETLMLEDYSSNKGKQFLQSFKSLFIVIKQFFISILHFLSMPILMIFQKRNYTESSSQFIRNVNQDMSLFGDIFKTKGVKFAIGFFIFDSFLWGLSLNIYNGSVKYVYAYNESHIALMQLVLNLSTIIFFIPLTKIADKIKRNEILFMSVMSGSLFFTTNIIAHFTLPEYRIYVILIGWAGLGVSIAFWVPGILSILTDFDPKRRAEVYGMVSGIKSLGWLPTGMIAGFIIERTIETMGLLVPFIISIVLFPFELYFTLKFPAKNNENIEEKEEN